jgi:DNA-binding MarR family transcriptional regulator
VQTRWLSDDEQATWRSFLAVQQLLDEALDRQLQRDAGLPHTYYAILVTLDEAEDGTLRMSELARRLRHSQSRMTHAVARLEHDGRVQRRPCPTDGRGQLATITAEGRRALAAAAPGHVAEVRARLFDRLSANQVTQLRRICQTLLEGLESS